MSGLSAAFIVWRDRVLQVIGAIGKFLSGDFTGAFDDAKDAVTGFGDAMVTAFNQAADATKALQEAQDDLTRNISVNRAKLDRDLARSKELISDETASYQDRKKAVDEVRIAQQKQANDELNNAKKTLLAKYQLALADKSNADALDEYRKAQADFYAIQQQQAADERAINKQAAAIDKQQSDEAAARQKEAAEARKAQQAEEAKLLKEATDKQIAYNKSIGEYFIEGVAFRNKQRQEQAEAQKKQDTEDLKAREQYLEDTTNAEWAAMQKTMKIVNDGAENEKKQAQAVAEAKINAANATGNALGALADLIGKQTIAGKALAIMQAGINTWLGVTQVLANKTVVPEPFGTIQKIASITAVIASGLAAVRNITKTSPGNASAGDTGGISAPALTAAPIAPQQTGTTIDQDSIRGIGNATSGRVYVLEQDVSHDQNRMERLNRSARLGG
jgi:hypothetical protein